MTAEQLQVLMGLNRLLDVIKEVHEDYEAGVRAPRVDRIFRAAGLPVPSGLDCNRRFMRTYEELEQENEELRRQLCAKAD